MDYWPDRKHGQRKIDGWLDGRITNMKIKQNDGWIDIKNVWIERKIDGWIDG